jgi:hypothetical protein
MGLLLKMLGVGGGGIIQKSKFLPPHTWIPLSKVKGSMLIAFEAKVMMSTFFD